MDIVTFIVGIAFGAVLGLGMAYLFKLFHLKTARELTEELRREQEQAGREQLEAVIDRVRESFKGLSLDALSQSTGQFLELAKSTLAEDRTKTSGELSEKKGLIDQQLKTMAGELERVKTLMNTLEKDREQKFGELSSQLVATGQQTQELMRVTGSLTEALASSKVRGQWGERMAEDVLRMAGFLEQKQYIKQKTIEGVGSRPDFTFLLPKGLTLNMDVKFPYDNYIKFLNAEADADREGFRKQFLADVKLKVKQLCTRDYINPEQHTVDYVLMFIPNEQVYAFINEQDATIIDESIKKKVIICSPVTLFAVLAVIRQAVDNFTFEQKVDEILTVFEKFRKQWGMYRDAFLKLGARIDTVRKEYDALNTTRTNQLETQVKRLDEIRTHRGHMLSDATDSAGDGV